jgi:hypothetical protein
MDRQHQKPRLFQIMIVLVIFFSLGFSAISCGPSSEDRRAKEEAERKELLRKEEARLKSISDQLLEKHNSVYFPPDGLGAAAFTYELQRFFSTYAKRAVLFKGYLEDAEKTERGIVVEFLCPLGEHFYVYKTAIRFRLTATEESVKQFLGVKRKDPMFRSLRYLSEPDYFVVAKIDELKRSRQNEQLNGSANSGEVKINIEIPASFLSTGVLIEAVTIPKDESATGKAR